MKCRPLRARRRIHLENLQRKARIRAEREYQKQFHVHERNRWATVQPEKLPYGDFYSRYMFAQGKFFNGGCGLARCGLCDYFTPSYRQKRQLEAMEYEYRAWLAGDFDSQE